MWSDSISLGVYHSSSIKVFTAYIATIWRHRRAAWNSSGRDLKEGPADSTTGRPRCHLQVTHCLKGRWDCGAWGGLLWNHEEEMVAWCCMWYHVMNNCRTKDGNKEAKLCKLAFASRFEMTVFVYEGQEYYSWCLPPTLLQLFAPILKRWSMETLDRNSNCLMPLWSFMHF